MMLVTTLCFWFYDDEGYIMLMTEWWRLFQCKESVINNLVTDMPQPSATSVTNINVAIDFDHFEKVKYYLRYVREGFETYNRHQETYAAKSIKYTISYAILNLACWPFGLNGWEKIRVLNYQKKIIWIILYDSHIRVTGMLSFSWEENSCISSNHCCQADCLFWNTKWCFYEKSWLT